MWLELVVLALIDLLRIVAIALVVWIGYLLYQAWQQRRRTSSRPNPPVPGTNLHNGILLPPPEPLPPPLNQPQLAKTAVLNHLVVTELRNTLIDLLQGDQDTVAHLIESTWNRYPARSEQWILEKIIHDLEAGQLEEHSLEERHLEERHSITDCN